MKVLICGDKQGFDRNDIGKAFKDLGISPTLVLTPAESDLEKYVQNWCIENDVPCKTQEIDWGNVDVAGAVVRNNRFGKPYNARAAFQRNEVLVLESDQVLHLYDCSRSSNSIVEEAGKTETPVMTWPKEEDEDVPF